MAAPKYLGIVTGIKTLIAAITSSAGAGDAEKIVATGTDGRLDVSLMPAGIGPSTVTLASSENLAAGDMVNFWDDSGTVKARKADATTAKPAMGFVLAGVTSPANATVYRLGQTNSQLTSLTKGARYYLSTTAGGVTATSPSASGNISQYLGVAISATELETMQEDFVQW